MSITIPGRSGNNYIFEGTYFSPDYIDDRSGVYAVLTANDTVLVDVGESATVRSRLMNHERTNCWRYKQNGSLSFAVFYTLNAQQSGRMNVEQDIRANFSNLCGSR